ncbi:hypothetical protein [Arthrobacter sp. efr-133-TYG-118]|uniref:hypothetical protein n=1 Tax=Arthrobacter sp. efr-133-TYG-118 TaxID=3040279 RepID=UPI00255074C8|nr:hypothetical protein [Arthrobacter sp. efr-133-TYG-118]
MSASALVMTGSVGSGAVALSLRTAGQPSLQHRDLLLLLGEFAVDDCRLLRIRRRGHSTSGVTLCPFDRFVAEDEGFFEASFTFQLLDRLNELEVMDAVDHAPLELLRPFATALQGFADHR